MLNNRKINLFYIYLTITLLIAIDITTSIAFSEERDPEKMLEQVNVRIEKLTLNIALDRAMRRNRTIQGLRLGLRGSEIGYDNAWDAMFLPSVNLVAASNSSMTVGHVPGAVNDANQNTTDVHGFPTSSLSLQLASYTLFNFWKDWAVYEQARINWVRQKEQYFEAIRAQRNQITVAFFKYGTELEKLEAAKQSVDTAEAVVELVKSQLRLKKADQSAVSSSEVDLLSAQTALNQQVVSTKSQLWTLNQLLGDPIGNQYVIEERVRFIPLKLQVDEALKIYFQNSPNIKDRKKDVKFSEMGLELSQKNRLPLPKVTFTGLTLSYGNNYYDNSNYFGPSTNSANLDISVGVSLSLPLLGPGGLFQGRTIEQSQIAMDQSDLSYLTTVNSDSVTIHQTIEQIVQAEKGVQISQDSFKKSSEVLDKLSSDLTTVAINRLELRDAISTARNSKIQEEDSIINHLQSKLSLAQLIGVDHLPGDPY